MKIYNLVPNTRKPALLIALFLMISVSGALIISLTRFSITEHTIIPLGFALIPICLIIGLWTLNSTTRTITLVMLWLFFLSAVINPWNPIYYLEFREKYHRIPDIYESILKSLPVLIISAFCIYSLMKYKSEFGSKQTHKVESPENGLPE